MEQYALKKEVDWYKDLVYQDANNAEHDCVFVGEFVCRQTDRRYVIVKSEDFVMTVFADYYTGEKISQDGILTGHLVSGCKVYNKKPKENWCIVFKTVKGSCINQTFFVYDSLSLARHHADEFVLEPIGFLEKNSSTWVPYDKEKGFL